MDVGNNSFRFTLDDAEKPPRTTRMPKTTELHVNSLDRFVDPFSPIRPFTQEQAQLTFYYVPFSPSSDCLIQTKRALLYGYFHRLAITEFQLKFRVPTIVTGVNDLLSMIVWPNNVQANAEYYTVTIPQGYYTTAALAAYLQVQIRATFASATAYTVTAPTDQAGTAQTGLVQTGFNFATNTTDTWAISYSDATLTAANFLRATKFSRTLGVGREAVGLTPEISSLIAQTFVPTVAFKTYSPNWLPTDYIDVVSKSLSNYKDSKDANATVQSPIGVLARIYLSDFASVQGATGNNVPDSMVWGSSPLNFTKHWFNPNWSQWSPNQAIDKIDIQLLDQWGNPLFWNSEYNTEWSMTLTATE